MSDTCLWEFRNLVLNLRDEAPPGFGADHLLPWLNEHPDVLTELREIGRPENHRRRIDRGDDVLQGLYALSRLADILIGPYQPGNDDPELLAWTTKGPWWSGPLPSPDAWTAFRTALGAASITEDDFHPFFHEIVEVVPDEDPDAPPALVAEVWPGALAGGLVLVRAGVVVRAGARRLDPAVAARSCLYSAWWRRNRVCRDLSHGWGGNSQWRTDFRRDYLVGDELHYNVDWAGRPDPNNPADDDTDVTADERRDLLRHRHSLLRDLGTERWPYHDALVEARTRPVLRR
ncbi:hypothetical protein QEZ54_18235 [Catellatospora sp. KI3]|uniref:hypothetical protein n=1 Tax=Catellatospora sp. KI3 TaxID=3041620 RepID=UPI0024832ABF|nr:hypothetical protein [Catellatospora sp. KI3]MDI1462919.1 hypothetical protein [Catellatospora sp. KI3]